MSLIDLPDAHPNDCPCTRCDPPDAILVQIAKVLAAPRESGARSAARMTSHEAAGFYRFPSTAALWAATARNPRTYPHERRGRRLLYIRPEVKPGTDAATEKRRR